MAKGNGRRSSVGRPRRGPDYLAELRRRHNQKLEEERDKHRRVRAALGPFARANASVARAQESYDTTVADLDRRRSEAAQRRDRTVAEHRKLMGAAAASVCQELPQADAAALLDVSASELKALLHLATDSVTAHDTADGGRGRTEPAASTTRTHHSGDDTGMARQGGASAGTASADPHGAA